MEVNGASRRSQNKRNKTTPWRVIRKRGGQASLSCVTPRDFVERHAGERPVKRKNLSLAARSIKFSPPAHPYLIVCIPL